MASLSSCFTMSPTKSRPISSSPRPSLIFAVNSFARVPTPRPAAAAPFPGVSYKFPNFKASRLVVRASSVDVTTPIRPGAAVETDKLPADVRNRTMDAVDGCGGRVTLGDVAGRAGLKLNEAQKALQALAADTDGFLEVSDEGDVLYVFPKDYRTKLAAKSFRLKIEPLVDKTKSTAEYLIRVSFGTALVASVVVVYTTIILLLSSRSDDDRRERRSSRSYGSGFNMYFNPIDLFRIWDPYYYRRRREQVDVNENMNFLESIFSFVFGDGDPNQGLEEERWKLIGQYISSNGGVVTAEELAPYLDIQTKDVFQNDESYVLPVLLKFDGQPEIDEEGNIVYRFPSLQRTASSQRSGRKEYVGRSKRWTDWVGGVQNYLEEKKLEFSKTNASERAMVIGLGGLNLFGVIVLGAMMKEMPITQGGWIQFVSSIFPLLQVYAGSFFAIPLVRWFLVSKSNAEIEKRNILRKEFAKVLELPDLSLRRKILSARDMAQKTVIGQDRIVYSTERDIIGQEIEAEDWERRFREIENKSE
ncbi:unnamed protein product [Linum tenue]|uniref:Iron-sulfur cluster biosynthesis family protein n=1 Tax=Linum tenue TaxID=586396 RepID=A0AAV0Q3H6_9ROSI|nr:unnamed protein product [Linum tenue]